MQIEFLLLKVAEFYHIYTRRNMCQFGKIYAVPVPTLTFWIYQEPSCPDYPFPMSMATHGRPTYVQIPTLNILMCFATQSWTKDPFKPVYI